MPLLPPAPATGTKQAEGAAQRERETREAVKRYRQGQSIREIAAALGRSYGCIHRRLTDAHVKLRKRGGPGRRGDNNAG